MKLSIVTTLYRSSMYVNEFYERISVEAKKITNDYEIIFVDDGSPDDSLQKAIALHKQDAKVIVVELSRNFGHHKAIMTGLSHAVGEYVFLIDSDLEEEPELLGRFWVELQNSDDTDVVYGVQESRKGRWFERWSGEIFYRTLEFLSDVKIPRNFLTVRLMVKNYVDNLVSFKERELNFSTIVGLNGFKSKEIKITKLTHSPTSYSLADKISIFVNAVTSSGTKILWVFFYFGLFITLVSFVFLAKLIVNKIFYGLSIGGWTSLMVSIWFFGGVIILFLGVIGIYVSKNYIESKKRPYTIVRKILKK